jgi:plasmid stabilization system protein ParE
VTVRYSQEARDDLDACIGYLAERNLRAALALRERVGSHLTLVDEGLLEGREVRITTGRIARRVVEKPLVIYYERVGGDVFVVRVLDGRRAPIERP